MCKVFLKMFRWFSRKDAASRSWAMRTLFLLIYSHYLVINCSLLPLYHTVVLYLLISAELVFESPLSTYRMPDRTLLFLRWSSCDDKTSWVACQSYIVTSTAIDNKWLWLCPSPTRSKETTVQEQLPTQMIIQHLISPLRSAFVKPKMPSSTNPSSVALSEFLVVCVAVPSKMSQDSSRKSCHQGFERTRSQESQRAISAISGISASACSLQQLMNHHLLAI